MKVFNIIASCFFLCLILGTLSVQGNGVGTCQQKVALCAAQPNTPLCCRWTPPPVNGVPTPTQEQCYSSTQYNCITDLSVGDACLCPTGLRCCNKACYDTAIHTCAVNNQPSSGAPARQLCPVSAPLSCNGACYSSQLFQCCPGAPGQGGNLRPVGTQCPVF